MSTTFHGALKYAGCSGIPSDVDTAPNKLSPPSVVSIPDDAKLPVGHALFDYASSTDNIDHALVKLDQRFHSIHCGATLTRDQELFCFVSNSSLQAKLQASTLEVLKLEEVRVMRQQQYLAESAIKVDSNNVLIEPQFRTAAGAAAAAELPYDASQTRTELCVSVKLWVAGPQSGYWLAFARGIGARRITVATVRPFTWMCENLTVHLADSRDRIVHGMSGSLVTTMNDIPLGMLQTAGTVVAGVMPLGNIYQSLGKMMNKYPQQFQDLAQLHLCACNCAPPSCLHFPV